MLKEWIDINHFTNNSVTLDNIKHNKKNLKENIKVCKKKNGQPKDTLAYPCNKAGDVCCKSQGGAGSVCVGKSNSWTTCCDQAAIYCDNTKDPGGGPGIVYCRTDQVLVCNESSCPFKESGLTCDDLKNEIAQGTCTCLDPDKNL